MTDFHLLLQPATLKCYSQGVSYFREHPAHYGKAYLDKVLGPSLVIILRIWNTEYIYILVVKIYLYVTELSI